MIRRLLQMAVLATAIGFATAAPAQKSFVRDDLASDAVRLEEQLKGEARATAGGAAGRAAPHGRAGGVGAQRFPACVCVVRGRCRGRAPGGRQLARPRQGCDLD